MRPFLSILLSFSLLTPMSGCYGSRIGYGDDDGGGDDDDDDDDDTGDDDTADDDTPPDDDSVDDDTTTDDDTAPTEFRLIEIDPDESPTTGGELVTLRFEGDLGGIDEDDVEVLFGTEAGEVVAITEDEILVTLPPACAAAEVEVRVESDAGSDEIDFEYLTWADGLDTAVFGAYRTEDRSTNPVGSSGSIELGFFEPNDSLPLQHLPPLETCTPTVVPPDYNRTYVQVGSSLTWTGSGTASVPWNSSTDSYSNGNVPLASLASGGSFSIQGAEDSNGCALELDNVVSAPAGLTVVQPLFDSEFADCWYMSNQGTSVPPLGIVEWTPPPSSQPTDAVFLQISDSTTGNLEYLCHAQDDGSFILDQTDILQLSQGLKILQVSRYRRIESIDPASGAVRHGVFVDTEVGYVFALLTDCECQLCR